MTAKALHGTRAVVFGTWLPLVLGVAGTVFGQEAPGVVPARNPRQVHIAPPAAAPAEAPAPTLSVEFKGGTIEEYIAILSKAAPDLNVVIRPETKEIPMPPVSLKGVAHGTALQLISALADSGDEITVIPMQDRGVPGSEVFVVAVKPPRAQAGMMPGTVMTAPARQLSVTPPPPVRPAKSVRVFSLRALTSGADALKPETVLTAIDTALGLQGTKEEASIKLHAESGLLVVHGAPEQIDVVEQVLTTMERDIRSQATVQQQALANENMNLKHTVESLKARLAELEARLAKAELDRVEKK